MKKKTPLKKKTPVRKSAPKMGTVGMAEDILTAVRDTYQMMADKYAGGSVDKMMSQFSLSAIITVDEKTTPIMMAGKKIGTAESLGGAVMGNGRLLICNAASIMQTMAENRSKETGEVYETCLTELMGDIFKRATSLSRGAGKMSGSLKGSSPVKWETLETDDNEGLKNPQTAQTFADMVKDLGIEDIQNLLG